MAISIGGTVVIDDGRNVVNVNDIKVGLVTITSSGNINTPGTITAGGFSFPLNLASFSPADGETNVAASTNITITFDQYIQKPTIGIGTTANITLRNSSGIGTVLQTIGVSSLSVTTNGPVVTISPPGGLRYSTDIYVVVDANAFTSPGGNSPLINTYNFTTRAPVLGDQYEGGFLICKASPLRWVVAPRSAEVSRTWYSNNEGTTSAQQVTGCTGWFIPTYAQLQNPGYNCRSFWGPSPCYSSTTYWSSTGTPDYRYACALNFVNGTFACRNRCGSYCVRAFRCVTY